VRRWRANRILHLISRGVGGCAPRRWRANRILHLIPGRGGYDSTRRPMPTRASLGAHDPHGEARHCTCRQHHRLLHTLPRCCRAHRPSVLLADRRSRTGSANRAARRRARGNKEIELAVRQISRAVAQSSLCGNSLTAAARLSSHQRKIKSPAPTTSRCRASLEMYKPPPRERAADDERNAGADSSFMRTDVLCTGHRRPCLQLPAERRAECAAQSPPRAAER
jgi:hypothetical protein